LSTLCRQLRDDEENQSEGKNQFGELIGHLEENAGLEGARIEGDVRVLDQDEDQEGNRAENMDQIVNGKTEGIEPAVFFAMGFVIRVMDDVSHGVTITHLLPACTREAIGIAFGPSLFFSMKRLEKVNQKNLNRGTKK
jgi:prolyl oligopeptidase PreP (S9A serine peptidase family)